MRRLFAVGAFFLLTFVVACHKTPPVPVLALEECDPAGYIPCVQQEAFASIPVTDTGVYLTYSSRWVPGPSGQHVWDAKGLGLGGWSINLVQRYDPQNRILIGGDGTWRLVDSVQLPSGELAVPSYDGAVAFIFDSAGRHVRTVDGHLGMELVKISYDNAGHLLQLDGSSNGQPVHFSVERDANGVPRALIGIDGGTTELALDGSGHLIVMSNPAGETTHIAWNSAGLVESETDAAGDVEKFTYDSSGRLASATDADDVTQHYERKASGDSVEVRITTALGRTWTYRAESVRAGIQRKFIKPDGTETTQTTDSHGNRTLKLADGTTWTVGVVASPMWGLASPILTPIVETRPDGVSSRQEVKYGLQPQRGLPYVLTGSVMTTINGQLWTQHFDPAQHTSHLVDPSGRRSIFQYDENGRLLSYSAPGVAPISYTYNAEGRVVSETIGTGNLARTTRYAYDNSGQIVTTRADGTVEKTTVDRAGRTVMASAGDGSTVVVGYDSAGRINQIQPPGGLNFTLGLSPAGRPTGFAPPMVQGDASVEIGAYDKDGRLRTVSGLGNRAVAYDYDSAGRVTSSSFDQGKRSLFYDSHSGFINKASDPGGVSTGYGYTGNRQTSLTWSGPLNGSVSVTLDANGRSARESVNGSNNLDFNYDPAGNLTEVGPLSLTHDSATGLVTHTALGVVETKQQFDDKNQLIRATTTAAGKIVLDLRYTRDALGRIKAVTEITSDGKTTNTEYSYDHADRLGSVRINGHAAETDTYDPAGNRVRVIRAGQKAEASYDERDRVNNLGARQYTWMPDGTLAGVAQGQHATAFVYDDFGALRQVGLPDGRKIRYLVDADGRRVGREVGGKFVAGYLYRPDGFIAAETDAEGKVTSRFGYDDRGHLALVERGGVTYRVITDTIGSPRLIVDWRTGAVAEEIAYDAWGNVTRDTAPGFIPIGFAGGLRDLDTGLVRFGARDYDPETGRWTALDPIRFNGGDTNLYRYAGGDPVNLTDRSGLFVPWWVVPEAIGAANVGMMLAGPAALGFGLTYGGGKLYQHFFPPNSGSPGNPPGNGGNLPGNGGNPPSNGNPPNKPWHCSSPTGTCGGPENGPNGGPTWGCQWGSCGNNGNGFYCNAGWCWGPQGDLCKAAIGSTCSYGDIHVRADRETHFDFQAAGEFLAAASPDGKFVIQARQEYLFEAKGVTFNTAVAANVDGDRVGIYAREPFFLMVNDTPIKDAEIPERRLAHGGALVRHGGIVNIWWHDGSLLTVKQVGITLNYGFVPSPNVRPLFRGVVVNAGESSSDTLTSRDGQLLNVSDPDFPTKLYRQFGNSWRIKPSESLFHYWPGESTAKFTDLNFPPKHVSVASLSSSERSKAESICRAMGVRAEPLLDDCILDVGITGMPAFAAASSGIHLAPASGSAGMSSYGSSGSAAPLKPDEYAINVGDTVSPDHPAAGAGIATHAGQTQSYSFAARAGQIIYFNSGSCEGGPLVFDLLDSVNRLIGGRGGCGDFGPVTLPTAGAYRIVVKADRPATRYTFSLRATTFDQYSIKIGDTVSPDRPVRGAGTIAQPGQQQSYSFAARAGQIIYFNSGSCEGGPPSFDLLDPTNNLIGGRGGCGDFGPVTLPRSGAYRIVVKADRPAARYTFTLRATTFDQYSIKIGDTVSPDRPVRGAGTIAQPGQQQSYSFAARAGQIIYFSSGACEGAFLWFDLLNAANNVIGGRGDCGDFGPVTLPAAGAYRIVVKADQSSARYTFSLRATTFDQYSIKIGDTVSPDRPVRGAGIIAQPGQQQSYSFEGRAGQTVYFSAATCEGAFLWFDLVNPANNAIGGRGSCGEFGPITLPTAGVYRISVKADRGSARYSFKISGQPISVR